jgi:hypothetical protein
MTRRIGDPSYGLFDARRVIRFAEQMYAGKMNSPDDWIQAHWQLYVCAKTAYELGAHLFLLEGWKNVDQSIRVS